ncbi:hypothetical protein Dimus_014415 [Dionaea muscipula]
MFGSTTSFGQSSGSPFGSQSVFGQTNNTSSNPFAQKPFGSATPFGTQTGTSIFGSTSTGVFGAAPSSSPLLSTPAFGASSSSGFGSATPSFGASSAPGFGSSSSSFSASSTFGQKPVFGSFGTQANPFGSTFQQSQPSFGSNVFGSTAPFGASSQPSFGVSSSSAFGSTNAPGFGPTSSSLFGSTTFGSTGTGFSMSSTPVFGSGGAFGASTTPVFGQSSTSPFGSPATANFSATSGPSFSASSAPGFGSSNTPTFGVSGTPTSAPAFATSATPSFSFGSSPGFGQTSTGFGNSPIGSAFGTQPSTPTFGSNAFGQSTFAGARGGSRIAPYTSTIDPDSGTGGQAAAKLESISAMPAYKDKSHEELRWEDYQQGDKGGPNPAAQSTGFNFSSNGQSNPFPSSSQLGQSSSNLFSSTTPSNPFSSKPPSNPFGSQGTSTSVFTPSPFSTSISNPFGTASGMTSIFSTSPGFGSSPSPSLFSTPSSSAFGLSASAQATTPSLNFNTQSSPLFQSNTPSLGLTSNLGQTASSIGQNPIPFPQQNIFNSSSSGLGGSLFGTSSLLPTTSTFNFPQATPSISAPFQATPPAGTSSAFSFPGFGQTQTAGTSGFGIGSSIFGQNLGQPSSSQSSLLVQPVTISSPFGTLPAMPQISISRAGTSSSVQYGISSMPVVDKPAPIRISSLLSTRHLSQRRVKLPARKYHSENGGLKVPFFRDSEEGPNAPKADAFFIPRENPRALIIRPVDQWPSIGNLDKTPPLNYTAMPVHGNGETSKEESRPSSDGCITMNANLITDKDEEKEGEDKSISPSQNNGTRDGVANPKGGDSYISLNGHRAGEAAIVYEHGADIEAMMPKLRHSDYYTEPRIQELAAKERAHPGFCRHVKNFVVGRHGFGSIVFLGETDVRRLDLESLVQFNHREVIVYMDESKKPPVGQGLNKPAEVTLLNIKCHDKKTGFQYTEGPKIEKYKEMLKKKAEDQGAEFVSYDAVAGEWKFRVNHFSKYNLGDEDGDVDAAVLSLCGP